MKFWNFQLNGHWVEVTSSSKLKKSDVIMELKKRGHEMKSKNIWLSINAPFDCPNTFKKSLFDL